jgi:hypothetical protein
MRRKALAAVAATSILLAGCGGQGESDIEIGEAPSAEISSNALSPNALSPNALSPNALSPNALSPNALSPNALSPDALAAIQDSGVAGDLSRQFLRYAVGCALTPLQSFSFEWTDASGVVHHEAYWGILGLVPGWETRSISVEEQRWVSACMAARTNWYGVSVTISSRGGNAALNPVHSREAKQYAVREGAFWGDLFAATPALFACNVPANAVHARSLQRDCAAGHLGSLGETEECGIIAIVGACDDVCGPTTNAGYHVSCASDPADETTSTLQVITTYLP